MHSFQNAQILPKIVGTRYCNLFLILERISCLITGYWSSRNFPELSNFVKNISHLLLSLCLTWASKQLVTFCSSGYIIVIFNVVNSKIHCWLGNSQVPRELSCDTKLGSWYILRQDNKDVLFSLSGESNGFCYFLLEKKDTGSIAGYQVPLAVLS